MSPRREHRARSVVPDPGSAWGADDSGSDRAHARGTGTAATRVAVRLARRHGSEVAIVAFHDHDAAAEVSSSLVVIGSRGLAGAAAVQSVSERVGHEAPCSVLVVRHHDSRT